MPDTPPLVDALVDLRDRLQGTPLSLEVPGVQAARVARDEVIAQIDDYVLPRVRQLEAPLLAVVGGSTGAGKSTIVNSIVRAPVSATGVLRPTTRVPILICNPEDIAWFESDRIFPNLTRSTGRTPDGATGLHLVSNPAIPRSLALLDAPDIDSVVEENRELAAKLLAAADLWLFVTTAARYADAVPWEFLRTAQRRSTAMAIVLNRVPDEAADDVPTHFAVMLKEHELGDTPVFSIPETDLTDALLPSAEIEPVSRWLVELARDAGSRNSVVRTTLEGALGSIQEKAGEVADEIDVESAKARELTEEVAHAYRVARTEVEDAISGGSLLRGEVLARWQEVVGTGELMRTLESRIGYLRDRIVRAFSGRPAAEEEVRTTLGQNLVTVVVATCDKAAERITATWRTSPAGKGLLANDAGALGRSSSGLTQGAADEVSAWQAHVLELVTAEGADKRAIGRAVSLGVNAVGAALMVAVFAHTGGLSGGEIVIAGGTVTVSQRLLEAIFGDQAVRSLAAQARLDLLQRIDKLLEKERERYEQLVKAAAPRQGDAASLRTTAMRLAEARV